MRIHINLVERLPTALVCLLIGGLVFPEITIYIAWIIVISRTLYCIMYVAKGPNWRIIGALPETIALYGLLVSSIYQLFSA